MHLAQAAAAFLLTYPELELSLSTDDAIVDVVEGGFDVVVRVTRLGDSTLVARKLASDRLVVCGSPAYLARVGTPASPADLVHHNCLHYSLVPAAAEWRLRGAQGPYVVPARSSLRSSDGTVLREVAGLGLAVLPSFMVVEELRADRLKLVLDGQRKAEIGIFAMFAQRKHLPLRTKLFLRFPVEHFATPPWSAKRRAMRV